MQGHTELVVEFDLLLESTKGEHDFMYAARLTHRIAAELFGRDLVGYWHDHKSSALVTVQKPVEGIQEALDGALREAFEAERITANYGHVCLQKKSSEAQERRIGTSHSTLAHLATMDLRDYDHGQPQETSYRDIRAIYIGRQELL
ncbi:MAG: hypothetical protein AABW64_04000 [Nanoarchaeota archaeon]